MYTNVGHDEAESCIKAALQENWHKFQSSNQITYPALCELLTLVLRANVFEFDNEYYCQKFGVSMGPLRLWTL